MLNRNTTGASRLSGFEELESRQLMSASYAIGINVNVGTTASVAKVVPVLKSMGVKTVRLWTSVSDFNNHTMGTLQRAIDYSNAGFDVTMEVNTANGKIPSASAVQGWFTWAASNTSLRNAVDRWEIGNEPDGRSYWQGSLSQYVTGYLKPAYEALHSFGETVVSAGPSWNPQDVQTMINAGLLNYTDYIGFHPYANGVSGVKNSVAQINAVVAGRKPIAATEWNVRGYEGDKAGWAAAVEDAYPYIKAGFALNYYFATMVQDSLAGPGGILTTSYAKNSLFYNAFATFAGATSEPVTPPSSDTGTGNTASGTASISGTVFADNDADGVFDSGESIGASRTVFIDSNGDGKLESGEKTTTTNSKGVYTFSGLAKGTYKVSRVFPSGYKLSNNSAGYVSATVTAGQKVSGVNLGSTFASTSIGGSTSSGGTTSGSTSGSTGGTTTTSGKPAVVSFQLINTSTGAVIATYTNTTNPVIVASKLPATVAVVAVGNSATKSMVLSVSGKKFTDSAAPYSFFGETNGKPNNWAFKKGNVTIGAAAWSGTNATGSTSATTYMTLTVI